MKKKQDSVNNTEMGRRGFLKRTVLASAAICIAPILEKVTAAEKSITGKSPVSATVFPVSIAAVRTQRTLGSGKAVFTVSAMGFGCMGLNHHRSQSPDEKACTRLIHEAIERGVTLFDTAESYGYHKNEKLVGEALKGYADRVFVSSKFGHKFVNGVRVNAEAVRFCPDNWFYRLRATLLLQCPNERGHRNGRIPTLIPHGVRGGWLHAILPDR